MRSSRRSRASFGATGAPFGSTIQPFGKWNHAASTQASATSPNSFSTSRMTGNGSYIASHYYPAQNSPPPPAPPTKPAPPPLPIARRLRLALGGISLQRVQLIGGQPVACGEHLVQGLHPVNPV